MMAATLKIDLTDDEAAQFTAVARIARPGVGGAELMAWAQDVAKAGLRDELVRMVVAQSLEEANTQRRDRLDTFEQAWPEPASDDPDA